VGAGLLSFANPDDAAAAVEEVVRDRSRHARAARALAEEHFDSSRVLRRLVDALGAGS
jgi:glycosyltransferase involved in cell wall biosynthesis